ncbi:glutamate-rich protein 6B [Protopterus annectens]|uniref:glutamate-rich protein 6B n=1 Tax=Protopterus annectens TaxID=7888 RepID=UPI001CFAC2E3|nr:glutamate-rich protein 6B [Protopterus annectens]
MNLYSAIYVELHLTHDKQCQARLQPPSDDDDEDEAEVTCEFCCQMAKPFPSRAQLATEPAEKLFCCGLYQDLYYYLLREQDTLATGIELIDIFANKTFSSKQARKEAMERAAQRMWEKEQEKYRAISRNSRFISHQTATISYQLSSSFCMEQGWTLPFPPFEELEVDNVFMPASDLYEKHLKGLRGLVQKLYPNGQPFVTLFSDGTGQVFYFSGNLAIAIISSLPTLCTFIILEDQDTCPKIQAVFQTNGHATCYHSNGVIRVNLTPYGGCCLDRNGTRQKQWQWRDFTNHVHAPPFQPICLSLNSSIGIRIISQEQVYITFRSKRNRVKFNMGARVMLKSPEKLRVKKPNVTEEEHLLQCKILKISTLLDKMQDAIKYPHSIPILTMQLEDQDRAATITDEGKNANHVKKALKSARK